MEEADELCDRVGIFVDGDFHCLGTPIEVWHKITHLTIAHVFLRRLFACIKKVTMLM
jgi:ABC-type multidrug transport system ATPase subunit